MITVSCPFGKSSCNGCDNNTTTGCCLVVPNTFISQEVIKILSTPNKEDLMKLSKEELVNLILKMYESNNDRTSLNEGINR